jgi:hypothetical protein
MTIRLTRTAPGHYRATVAAKYSGLPPIEITVVGPDPHYRSETTFGYRWVVNTDTERFFNTLREARIYLNRFFEKV